MAENVTGHAIACLVQDESPRQQTEFVTAVHRQEATAVVGDLAECARCDELACVQDQRGPQVVVADTASDARRCCRVECCNRMLRFSANRFLAEDSFARRGGCFNHGDVQHVRSGYPDNVDVVRVNGVAPVGYGAFKSEVSDCAIAALLLCVRTNDQHRVKRAVGE